MIHPGSSLERRISDSVRDIPPERLPILVELSGMPRLGKTVFCDSLVDLVRKSGRTVRLAAKATAECPIADRWSCEYSTWSLLSTVRDYLEARELRIDVLVADRGLFDAVAWLKVKQARGMCPPQTVSALRAFATNGPWRSNLAAVLVFLGSEELVLSRALERRLYEGPSDVTTRETLGELEEAIRDETNEWNVVDGTVKLLTVGEEPLRVLLDAAAEAAVSAFERYSRR